MTQIISGGINQRKNEVARSKQKGVQWIHCLNFSEATKKMSGHKYPLIKSISFL